MAMAIAALSVCAFLAIRASQSMRVALAVLSAPYVLPHVPYVSIRWCYHAI